VQVGANPELHLGRGAEDPIGAFAQDLEVVLLNPLDEEQIRDFQLEQRVGRLTRPQGSKPGVERLLSRESKPNFLEDPVPEYRCWIGSHGNGPCQAEGKGGYPQARCGSGAASFGPNAADAESTVETVGLLSTPGAWAGTR